MASTWRYSGCTPADRATSRRRVCAPARMEASDSAVPPSYREALLTSMPVSSQMAVWNSKMLCSTPWLRSGWYGVYAVRNSPRLTTASTTAGTW